MKFKIFCLLLAAIQSCAIVSADDSSADESDGVQCLQDYLIWKGKIDFDDFPTNKLSVH